MILTLLIALLPLISGESPPLVTLPDLGSIEGGSGRTLNGRPFYKFEGIPYARPPIGENRFKEPKPVKPWDGVWEAKTIYKCIQYNQYTPPGEDYVIGEEDCLYLNVYTPRIDENANLDVVVYIHGGAFMFNWGGLHGPDYILDRDVVYINLNYRLGPLGFLTTESKLLPGNNGLRDQIAALEFIRKHVRHFGGNPDSVTIMGMSAGGASVHFHYLSPKSRGLFHRGISQSGCTLNPWVLMENGLEKTKKLAVTVGCQTADVKLMIKCLKTRPARQIVAAVKEFQPWLYNPFSPFGLVVDSWASEPVLPKHPFVLLKQKKVYDVPWIVSYTASEGLYPAHDWYNCALLSEIDTRWNELLPFLLDYNYTVDPKRQDEVSRKIRQHYLGSKTVSKSTYNDLVPILSDRHFVVDLQKTARYHSAATKSPVYSYHFTYRGGRSWSNYRTGTDLDFGASHGDDTPYVFRIEAVDTTTTERDRAMIGLFVDLVTSFARTGKPEVPVEWPQVPKDPKEGFVYLRIESPEQLTVGEGVSENAAFWDSLPLREAANLFPEVKDEL